MTQALSDIGFSVPAQAGTYWAGEAMQTVDYQDLDQVPENVASATAGAARNAAHLARLLRAEPYPAGSWKTASAGRWCLRKRRRLALTGL